PYAGCCGRGGIARCPRIPIDGGTSGRAFRHPYRSTEQWDRARLARPWIGCRHRLRSLEYVLLEAETSVMKESLTPHHRDREASLNYGAVTRSRRIRRAIPCSDVAEQRNGIIQKRVALVA